MLRLIFKLVVTALAVIFTILSLCVFVTVGVSALLHIGG